MLVEKQNSVCFKRGSNIVFFSAHNILTQSSDRLKSLMRTSQYHIYKPNRVLMIYFRLSIFSTPLSLQNKFGKCIKPTCRNCCHTQNKMTRQKNPKKCCLVKKKLWHQVIMSLLTKFTSRTKFAHFVCVRKYQNILKFE